MKAKDYMKIKVKPLDCYDCQNHHSMDCPNSSKCWSTFSKPYFKKKENNQ